MQSKARTKNAGLNDPSPQDSKNEINEIIPRFSLAQPKQNFPSTLVIENMRTAKEVFRRELLFAKRT
jgi:hypothetical protein